MNIKTLMRMSSYFLSTLPNFRLLDASAVESGRVAAGVGEVVGVGGGKIVRAGKVFFGTHIYIWVSGVVEHAFYGRF